MNVTWSIEADDKNLGLTVPEIRGFLDGLGIQDQEPDAHFRVRVQVGVFGQIKKMTVISGRKGKP